eukprot:5616455-Heterocapsa_arctica.AAC.1
MSLDDPDGADGAVAAGGGVDLHLPTKGVARGADLGGGDVARQANEPPGGHGGCAVQQCPCRDSLGGQNADPNTGLTHGQPRVAGDSDAKGPGCRDVPTRSWLAVVPDDHVVLLKPVERCDENAQELGEASARDAELRGHHLVVPVETEDPHAHELLDGSLNAGVLQAEGQELAQRGVAPGHERGPLGLGTEEFVRCTEMPRTTTPTPG